MTTSTGHKPHQSCRPNEDLPTMIMPASLVELYWQGAYHWRWKIQCTNLQGRCLRPARSSSLISGSHLPIALCGSNGVSLKLTPAPRVQCQDLTCALAAASFCVQSLNCSTGSTLNASASLPPSTCSATWAAETLPRKKYEDDALLQGSFYEL